MVVFKTILYLVYVFFPRNRELLPLIQQKTLDMVKPLSLQPIVISNVEIDDVINEKIWLLNKYKNEVTDFSSILYSKINDKILFLELYKNQANNEDSILKQVLFNIDNKKQWILSRIINNNMKLRETRINSEYFKVSIENEITTKGLSVKLKKVQKLRERYFETEIEMIEKRINVLSVKLSLLNNIEISFRSDSLVVFLERYVKTFVYSLLMSLEDIIPIIDRKLSSEYYKNIHVKKRTFNGNIQSKINHECVKYGLIEFSR